jgi:Fe-S cluster assembly protein SufD
MTNMAGANPLVEKWSQAFQEAENPAGPDWMRSLRETAAGQFSVNGLPDRKTEAWKYTPMRFLESLNPGLDAGGVEQPQGVAFPGPVCAADGGVIDIANGTISGDLPGGAASVSILPLAAGVEVYEERLRRLLDSVNIEGPDRAFAALNTAFLEQGLVIHVDRDAQVGSLLIRWAFSGAGPSVLGNFRVFLLLEPGARLNLAEQFESVSGTANALNVVMQAELGAGATLGHTRVQNESETTVILTSTSITQAAGSRYTYSGFDLGGGLVRHELNTELAGRGAEAEYRGAFVLNGKRHVDNHISVDHASPGCSSTQFFRGVLGGRSRGVFNGRALIRPGADESSVRQSNANLLLSGLAEMDSKPELEIYADEVEASHGATVGQLDESAVFYLRSRGLSDADARRMLTTAFCRAVTDRLEDRVLAEKLLEMLDEAMPDGLPGEAEGI